MIKNSTYIYGLVTLLIAFTVSLTTASAQKMADNSASVVKSLKGKVVDASQGQPLSGVKVQLKELNKETTTDAEGLFIFEGIDSQSSASANAESMQSSSSQYTVVINHDGYKKLTKTINIRDLQEGSQNQQPMVLKLKPSGEAIY